jgi:hypothetical protein
MNHLHEDLIYSLIKTLSLVIMLISLFSQCSVINESVFLTPKSDAHFIKLYYL